MKKILLILILFITGCESDYQINCYLNTNDEDGVFTNTLVGIFEDSKLITIKNSGEAIYNNDTANTVYTYMNEMFTNMNNDGVMTYLSVDDNKLYYEIEYNFNTMSKKSIKKNLGYYGRTNLFFKNYAKKQGYSCE